MQVINLFAGPGAGKSTTAAGLFHQMKIRGMNVELITEYAKDMTWERRFNILSDQLYILAKQHRRQSRLRGQVDWVVTDSPLLLSLNYVPDEYHKSFKYLVLDLWNDFENHNFFLQRLKPYHQVGRSQTEEEARQIDSNVRKLLQLHDVPFELIPGTPEAVDLILEKVL